MKKKIEDIDFQKAYLSQFYKSIDNIIKSINNLRKNKKLMKKLKKIRLKK